MPLLSYSAIIFFVSVFVVLVIVAYRSVVVITCILLILAVFVKLSVAYENTLCVIALDGLPAAVIVIREDRVASVLKAGYRLDAVRLLVPALEIARFVARSSFPELAVFKVFFTCPQVALLVILMEDSAGIVVFLPVYLSSEITVFFCGDLYSLILNISVMLGS